VVSLAGSYPTFPAASAKWGRQGGFPLPANAKGLKGSPTFGDSLHPACPLVSRDRQLYRSSAARLRNASTFTESFSR